ncbi:hypothetical protein Moror_14667, partial [Moniliophthora roreri MCA 2997]
TNPPNIDSIVRFSERYIEVRRPRLSQRLHETIMGEKSGPSSGGVARDCDLILDSMELTPPKKPRRDDILGGHHVLFLSGLEWLGTEAAGVEGFEDSHTPNVLRADGRQNLLRGSSSGLAFCEQTQNGH